VRIGRGQRALFVTASALLFACASTGPDPLERSNRKVFWFNEKVDRYALEPVAKGWDAAIPERAQLALRHFFENLQMPIVMANDILQLKPRAVLDDVLRLLTNTTFGLGGFLDVASREGIPLNDEGFGQTLGWWGVPEGTYLMLPFLGPSTPRQLVGTAADAAGSVPSYFIPLWASVASRSVDILNTRARYLEEVDQNRHDAFDYYLFVRDAYLNNLRKRVADGEAEPEQEDEDDLYYFEEDTE
jgi:phospholipid-binding lipoprotein MlaA